MIFHRYFHTFYKCHPHPQILKFYDFFTDISTHFTNIIVFHFSATDFTQILQISSNPKIAVFDISVAYLSNIMKSKYCNFIYNWDSIVVQWESSPTVYQVQFGKLFMYAWKEKKNSLILIQGVFFNWDPPKSSKCQPVSKFWQLELFWYTTM